MDTTERLLQLLQERNWTHYELSKKSGLAQSTIANVFARNTVPSVATLEKICNAFQITLSQFFAESEDSLVEITADQKELFDLWLGLTVEQRDVLLQMARILNKSN